MLDNFTPVIHRFDNRDIKIYVVGDIHVGAPGFNVKAWSDFHARLQAEPDSFIVLCGDLMDNALKTSVSDSYEAVIRPRDQKDWLIGQLRPIKDKILGIVPGNHEKRTKKSTDSEPVYDICRVLGIEDRYRDISCCMILRFGERQGGGRGTSCYTIWMQHGAGGGKWTGSGVTRNEQFGYAFDGVDLLVTGHTHKVATAVPEKIVVDPRNGKVTMREFQPVIAGSWQQYGGYALDAQMMPSASRIPEIHLKGTEKVFRVMV